MAKNKITVKSLPITTFIPLDLSKNVRDPSGSFYDVKGLKAEILQDGGIKVRPLVHFLGGKFDRVVQGYRRILSVTELHSEFPHDTRWNSVEVEVVENLTEAEIMDLMSDHGNTKSLEKHEIVRAMWMTLDANPTITDDQLAVKHHGLLGIHFPAGSALEKEEDIARHYRGTVQNIRNGFRLPEIAQKVFLLKIRGESKYPTKKEVATLVKIFEDERRADVSSAITKAKPGPVFLAKWQELEDAYAEAAGTTRPKALSAFSREQMLTFGENSASRILRLITKVFCRDIPEADKRGAVLSRYLSLKVEPLVSPEMWAEITAIMEGKSVELPDVPVLAKSQV